MKFLLDANMPRSALAALRAFGHSVEHVRDIGLGDADERVAASTNAATAALVSRDLDFADVRRFPPQNTPPSKLDTHFLAVRCQIPAEAGPCPHSLAHRPQAAVS